MNTTQQHAHKLQYHLEGYNAWEIASLCDISTQAYNNAKKGVDVRHNTKQRIEAISALLQKLVDNNPAGSPHYYYTKIIQAKNKNSRWRTTNTPKSCGLSSE